MKTCRNIQGISFARGNTGGVRLVANGNDSNSAIEFETGTDCDFLALEGQRAE